MKIGGIDIPNFSDVKFSYAMNGMGTSGVLTGTMTFKTYYQAVSGDAFPWGAEVEFACENDSSIIIPKFYVYNRKVNGAFTSWSCSDRMAKIDVPVTFEEYMFTDDKINSRRVVGMCASACGFLGAAYSSNSLELITAIGDVDRSLVDGKTAREILDMYATAMCGYWLNNDDNHLIFSPFGHAYRGLAVQRHTPISEGGTKKCSRVIMYNGDETYISGSGSAQNTIMISTPLASRELCGRVYSSINSFEYKSWECEKGLANQYIYPGDILFPDGTIRYCTSVTMYPSAAGIFFTASGNNVSENECTYENSVKRQLKRKLELDVRNGNMAVTKEGLKFFTNYNRTADKREKTTVIKAFKSEV